MTNSLRFTRNVEIRKEVDVCIIGGGPAGCAAAIAAAKNGAKVYLAEAHTCLGGLGTAGRVPLFMTFTDGINFVADGIGRNILDRMHEDGQIGPNPRFINAEKLKRVYDDMLIEAGVDFTLMTEFIGTEVTDGKITQAIFNAKSGMFAVSAGVFIDCTGDGDLAAEAGAEVMYGDDQNNVMPSTLCSVWANIDWPKFRESGKNPREVLFDAFEDGIFRNNDPHHTGINQTGVKLGGGNMGHLFGLNPLDEKSLTDGLVEGRKQAVEFERYYREYIPGYEDVELSATADLPGIRESRRIVGDYILSFDDYKERGVFDDEIGRYCYSIDIHPASPAEKDQEEFRRLMQDLHYKGGESYGIPYRSLIVKGFDNLLTAGRCMSTDRYLQSSIRVMPGCYITGQAAGLAASLAIAENNDVREISVNELQEKLKELGAYLPNY